MTSKNPFELRYELLNFAQNTLTGEYYAALERRILQENRSKTAEGGIITLPTYPTVDEIFSLATKYKTFIEEK